MVAVEVDEDLLGVVDAVDALDLEAQARALRGRPLALGRGRRDGRGPLARVSERQVAEVGEQMPAPLGLDRLGMELDAPDRPRAVGEPHQHAVAGPGRALELLGQRLGDAERVVAHHLEALGDAGEQRRVVVVDGALAAVHHLGCVHDLAAGEVPDALVAEADAQQRLLGLADGVGADAEVLGVGRACPGRARRPRCRTPRRPAPPRWRRRCGRPWAPRRSPPPAAGRGCR